MAGKSPRTVAIQASLAVGLLSMAATGMAMWLSGVTQGWWLPPLLGGAVGAVSFAMIYRQLGVYIQDRVRIIYKTIRRLKGSGNQIQLDMAEDIVEQVNRDVMAWADLQIEEITHLRETDTFRQEFIGNLAHELKTPIFNIQGFILTLLEGGMEDPEINRKFLLKAAKNVERMSGLLEDLDVITKMEAGNLDIELVPFDLLDIIRETMESLEAKAKRNDIELAAKGSIDATTVMVLGDASKIVQVLTNLIVNSINYGREGGEPRFATSTPTKRFWWKWPTRALASTKTTCLGCLSGSTASTSRVLDTPGVLGWAWPLSSTSLKPTTSPSACEARLGRDQPSASPCRRPDPRPLTNGLDVRSAPMVVGPPCPGHTTTSSGSE